MATITVSLGENSKLTALPSERDRIRKFYRDVLGCPATKESERIDIFRVGSGFYSGVVYERFRPRPIGRLESNVVGPSDRSARGTETENPRLWD